MELRVWGRQNFVSKLGGLFCHQLQMNPTASQNTPRSSRDQPVTNPWPKNTPLTSLWRRDPWPPVTARDLNTTFVLWEVRPQWLPVTGVTGGHGWSRVVPTYERWRRILGSRVGHGLLLRLSCLCIEPFVHAEPFQSSTELESNGHQGGTFGFDGESKPGCGRDDGSRSARSNSSPMWRGHTSQFGHSWRHPSNVGGWVLPFICGFTFVFSHPSLGLSRRHSQGMLIRQGWQFG